MIINLQKILTFVGDRCVWLYEEPTGHGGREYDYFKTGSRISAISSKFVAISSGILVWNCLPSSHGLPVNSGLYIMDTISHMRTEYAD